MFVNGIPYDEWKTRTQRKVEFLPEVWDIIKEFAGVYHIGTEWRHVTYLRYWEIGRILQHCGVPHNDPLVRIPPKNEFNLLMKNLSLFKTKKLWQELYMYGDIRNIHAMYGEKRGTKYGYKYPYTHVPLDLSQYSVGDHVLAVFKKKGGGHIAWDAEITKINRVSFKLGRTLLKVDTVYSLIKVENTEHCAKLRKYLPLETYDLFALAFGKGMPKRPLSGKPW